MITAAVAWNGRTTAVLYLANKKMQGKITALKSQKRNSQRINVYLDGEFAFGLSRFAAVWLQIGQELGPEKIRELQAVDAREVAFQHAQTFLSYRARSSKEIRDNLSKHGLQDDVIDEVLERLMRNQLVDDRQFARAWIANRSEFRPRGRRALAMELRQKGIQDEIITDALDGIDEEELAYQAALKPARRYIELDWPEFRQKMSAFLARRGFSYEVATTVVRRVWSEQHQT